MDFSCKCVWCAWTPHRGCHLGFSALGICGAPLAAGPRAESSRINSSRGEEMLCEQAHGMSAESGATWELAWGQNLRRCEPAFASPFVIEVCWVWCSLVIGYNSGEWSICNTPPCDYEFGQKHIRAQLQTQKHARAQPQTPSLWSTWKFIIS